MFRDVCNLPSYLTHSCLGFEFLVWNPFPVGCGRSLLCSVSSANEKSGAILSHYFVCNLVFPSECFSNDLLFSLNFFFIVGISVKYFKLHLSWLPLICNLKFLFQPKRFPSYDDHFPLSLLELFSKWALGLWSCLPRVTFSFLFHVSVLSSKCWETSSILSSRILSPVMSSLLFSPLDDSFIHCMFNFQDLVVLCVLFVFRSGMFLLFV